MTENTPYTAQLYTDAATGELKERAFQVVVVAGPDQGLTRKLEGGTTIIGTHPNTDILLSDNTVSRYHLELQVLRDGVKVTDLDTTNGTRYRGSRVGSITVTESAHIKIGKRTEIEIAPAAAPVPLGEFSGDRFGHVLGRSPAMRPLFALLSRVAATEATVLLEGETGTGKEALAESIHAQSPRAKHPFVVVDCAAIPRDLIGSELFGHVRGAYTGATNDKDGLIVAASGGTVFLDEIGELALDLQPQLLRVLEKREVRPVGDTRAIKVDIRVVAATNRDLRAMVKAGTFREDLYYRLAVVRALVPPLRNRTEDIPLLARHFTDALGHGELDLSAELRAELANHTWPGNVRELRNVVERALSLGYVGLPGDHDASSSAGTPPPAYIGAAPDISAGEEVLELPFKEAKSRLIESFERDYLTQLLHRHRGNISRAANEAGIDRNYIHRLVKKYNITIDRG
ncbi:MAG TPA: sigma 54-interacting transcriptional regulator [Kofleriaceae bacterium]|nr:sigma 54-interacting transcriptional regulator [Kofleriaceae bacterium]